MNQETVQQLAEAAAELSAEECLQQITASAHNIPEPEKLVTYLHSMSEEVPEEDEDELEEAPEMPA